MIRAAREARGMTQAELATRVGTKQQTVDKIEKGKINYSRFLRRIALELRLDIEKIVPEYANQPQVPGLVPDNRTGSDFPVHAAVEGGPGELIVSSEPVSWVVRPSPLIGVSKSYGVIVVGESMVPEFRPGDTALVNPHLPPERGSTFVFFSETYGDRRATIKHLVRWSEGLWYLRQWSPPRGQKEEFTLPRSEWPICHRVVGRYVR